MKNYKQKLSLAMISTVVLLGVSFVGAQTDETVIKDNIIKPVAGSGGSSFSGPCGAPGTCNAPEFLSVSPSEQTKSGALRMFGLRLKDLLFVGYEHSEDLTVRANGTMFPGESLPIIFGVNGNAGALKYCDHNGLDCFAPSQITDLLNMQIDESLVCGANPAASTLTDSNGVPLTIPYAEYASSRANSDISNYQFVNGELFYRNTDTKIGTQSAKAWGYSSINLPGYNTSSPTGCNADEGCVLKQVMYKRVVGPNSNYWKDYVARVRYVDYREDFNTGSWTSTDNIRGGTNGNTTSTNIFRGYSTVSATTGTTYQVILRDDTNTSNPNKEIAKKVVKPYDNWGAAGEEIYVCTYPADTAN